MSTWQIDPAHSSITFSARHMVVATVRGRFTELSGTVELDETEPARSTVEAHIAAASVDTGVESRDNHLRSADFFDAATYPELTFRSTAIEPAGDGYRIHGDLTIRDVTRPVTLDAELSGVVAGMDGKRRAGFGATTRLRRTDWGLNWNVALEAGGWLVGEEIRIQLDVEAIEAKEAIAIAGSVAA